MEIQYKSVQIIFSIVNLQVLTSICRQIKSFMLDHNSSIELVYSLSNQSWSTINLKNPFKICAEEFQIHKVQNKISRIDMVQTLSFFLNCKINLNRAVYRVVWILVEYDVKICILQWFLPINWNFIICNNCLSFIFKFY